MRINYLVNRFYQMKHNYIGKTTFVYTMYLWFDYFVALFFYGASISDYFAYGFYKLRRRGRNEYITYRRYLEIMRIANDKKDIEICRSKIKFNQYFSDILGREWIDVADCTFDEFKNFVVSHDCFFVKEILSFRGIGVRKINSLTINNVENFYKELLSQKDCHFILEEEIKQIDSLKRFHPWSVNTIRIVTLYDTINDEVHIMNARFRMGNKKNNVDNFHFDGIGANIDILSGVIDTIGYDAHNKIYVFHPETNSQIIGFQIPQWNECISFIKMAAKRLPTVRYIGWDLVIKQDGTICLIEANDNADHDFQQLHNKGLWREYKNILKNLK